MSRDDIRSALEWALSRKFDRFDFNEPAWRNGTPGFGMSMTIDGLSISAGFKVADWSEKQIGAAVHRALKFWSGRLDGRVVWRR